MTERDEARSAGYRGCHGFASGAPPLEDRRRCAGGRRPLVWLDDRVVARLQAGLAEPDLSGTRYRLLALAGRGGMGAVYRALDTTLDREVALKVIDPGDDGGAELGARLVREAHILARLEHPGIVPVHDVGTLADGRVFYAMKLVDGARLDRQTGALGSLSDRLRLFLRVAEPVAFAHSRGVLHRDLKPANIMLGPFGEVLVLDWGIAKILAADEDEPRGEGGGRDRRVSASADGVATAHGTVLGTAGYMAPEQARGEVDRLDQRTDVFGLGGVLRYLASASPGAEPPPPKPVQAIALKATAAAPEDRYPSVDQMAADVRCYLDGLPVSALPEGIGRRVARVVARHRVAVVLVAAYLAMRIVLLLTSGR